MVYKWCAVPGCTNTSIKTPEKVFISLPKNRNIREKWMLLAHRNPRDISDNTNAFFCEDHFCMEKDIANFCQYKMGFCQKLIVAEGAMPSKFYCQPDRRKSLSDESSTFRPTFLKQQKTEMLIGRFERQEESQAIESDPAVVTEIPIITDCRPLNSVGNFGRTTLPNSSQNVRKICFIQGCRNTSMRFPNLYFFEVPSTDVEAKRKWLTIARREEHINNRIARWYCCEEHFEVEDIENYEQFKLYQAIPILRKDVVPHVLPSISAPSLPVPKRANIEEWDKFKRRLIRAVSRLLFKEKKPDDEVWAFLKKETGCDCLLLWDRMRSLTLKKMSRLLLADDHVASIPSVARMTLTDWLMCDLVLVHEDIDVLGRKPKSLLCEEFSKPMTRDYHPLINLFSIVQKFNVEELEGESLALAWSAASKYYNTGGRQCSPMLLQRRWYQLKEWTRTHFYEFWHSYRGNKARYELNKGNMPGKLQRAVARRFPGVITERFCDWEQLIKWEKVILPEHFEAIAHKELPKPSEDDDADLIILEQAIETINVDSDDDSTSKETAPDDIAATFETNVTSEMEDCGFDPSKVKDEPITEIDIEEHEFDKNALLLDSTRKALEEVDKAFAAYETTTSDKDEVVDDISDDPVSLAYNTDEQDIDMEKDNLDNFDDTAQSGFDIQMPMITNVFGNIEEKELSNLSAKSAEKPPMEENITEIVDEDDEDNVDDIIKIKVDEFIEKSQNNAQNTNMDKLALSDSDTTKDKFILDIEKDVNDFNETSDVNFMDEGIEFLDDGIEEDDVVVIKSEPEMKTEENIKQEETVTPPPDTPKFDLKLLMEPVVYTTKLDQMHIFKNKNFMTVKLEPIINSMLEKESKPVSKQSISYKQELENEEKLEVCESEIENLDSDDIQDLIKKEPEEIKVRKIEIEDEFDIEYHQRIKLTSNLLQKPKNREYTPVQICKNPDFNTRLKRLNMGFYNYERNIQYFNMCKPLTIDLHKAFESKLIEGTLYLKPSEPVDNQPQTRENDLDHSVNINIVPFAGPVQSLMNVPKPTSEELLAVSSSATMTSAASFVTSPVKETHNDVVQVSRLNSPMPQPCLLAPSEPPPYKIPNPLFSEIAKRFTGKTRGRPPLKPYEYMDRRYKQKEKFVVARPRRQFTRPHWFDNKFKPQIPKLDEFLIQPDVLTKMLLLMNGKEKPVCGTTKNEKRQLWKKARRTIMIATEDLCRQVVDTTVTISEDNQVPSDIETPNKVLVEESSTDNVTKEVHAEENVTKEVHAEENVTEEVHPAANIDEDKTSTDQKQTHEVRKSTETQTDEVIDLDIDDKSNETVTVKPKPRKYCCWARRKIVNIGKKHYIKHNCLLDDCKCCCMDEFQKKMAKYRNYMINDYKTKVQREMQKQKKTYSDPVPIAPTPNKPVAHIKIVPRSGIQSALKVAETDQIKPKIKIVPKTRPSIIIDGTSTAMLVAKGVTRSPIYVGKNKVLLTSMKLPAYLDAAKQPEVISSKVITKTPLPPGVQLVMLPDGSVTFTLDPNTVLTQEQINQIPNILSAVKKQLSNNNSMLAQSPKKNQEINNSVNTSDEIVISDDDEPNREADSDLKNKPEQNQNTDDTNKAPVLSRNSLLSDLMQMSGISFEDTELQSQPPVVIQNQVAPEDGTVQPQLLESTLPITGPEASLSEDSVTSTCDVVLPDVIPSITISSESSVPIDSSLAVDKVPESLDTSTDAVIEGITAINNVLENVPEVTGPLAVSLTTDANASVCSEDINSPVPISISIDNIAAEVSVSTNAPSPKLSELSNSMPAVITADPPLPLQFSSSEVDAEHPNIIRPSLNEFTLITSFAKLRYVVEHEGQFFKLDLDTGIVVPINVSVKKKVKVSPCNKSLLRRIRPRTATIETEEIDLTEEDLPQFVIPNNLLNQEESPSNDPNPPLIRLAPQHKLLKPTEAPRPLKLIKATQPSILRKKIRLSATPPDDIFVVKQKRKERLMTRIMTANTARSMQIEIIDSDEDDLQEEEGEAPSQAKDPKAKVPQPDNHDNASDSSDDEPLSKISKRIHSPANKSNETETTSEIKNNEPQGVDKDNQLSVKENDKIEYILVPKSKSPEAAISETTPMEVDPGNSSLSIDLQTQPSPKSLLLPKESFTSCEMPMYNDLENSTDESEDCILGV